MKRIFITLVFSIFSISLFSQIKIYTTSGNIIECQSIVKKRFGFEYIPTNTYDNYKEYIANTKIDRIEYANGDIDYVSGTPNKQTKRKDPKDFTFLNPNYVSLNVGPSVPYAALAGTNSGYSMIGVNVDLDATFYPFRGLGSGSLFEGVGVGILTGYSYNPFNGTQHQAFVTNQLLADTSVTITNLNVKVGGWNTYYILGGVGYNNDFGRLMIDYKVLIGGLFSGYPTADATYTNNGVARTSTFTSSTFTYMLGLYGSIRYFLTRKLSLKGNISLLSSTARFDELIRKDYEDGKLVSSFSISPFTTSSMASFNFTLGVAYTIGK